MKNSRGFTLIELVIVIVILGILGAVAAPRFINMQGDAYEANVKALGGSIQSAMTLANTKAILGGYDKGTGYADAKFKKVEAPNDEGVDFINGFPTANDKGIIAMLQDTDSFGVEGESAASDSTYSYSGAADTAEAILTIYPSARYSDKATCNVTYTAAKTDEPAKVKVTTTKC